MIFKTTHIVVLVVTYCLYIVQHLGSLAEPRGSLDPDEVQRTNEDRLRRLKELAGLVSIFWLWAVIDCVKLVTAFWYIHTSMLLLTT